MKNFDEYIVSWFHNYLLEHEEEEGFDLEIFNSVVERTEDDSLDDYLSEDEGVFDYLFGLDAEVIWKKLIRPGDIDDFPDMEEFLTDMFMQAVDEQFQHDYNQPYYSFVQSFVDDMAYHAENYDNPIGFFKDLAYGGCQSGTVGMLIYNNDCKKIYVEHIDDMELIKEYLEDEMGEPVRNKEKLPHYTFMCWLCYEELGHNIARNLFPDFF